MYTLGMKYKLWPAPEEVVPEVLRRLARYSPFVFHRSVDRRSVYVHFRKLPNELQHKLRISDHDERDRYGYKWQLRLDGVEFVKQKTWSRYFRTVDELCEEFIGYYTNVERSGRDQVHSDRMPTKIDWKSIRKRRRR